MTIDDRVHTALTIDDQLDDIKRAQIWARLEPQLASAAPRRLRWPIAFGVATACAAAAVAFVATRPSGSSRPAYVAPADTTLSLHLGDHTRAALVGPGRLEPLEISPTTTVVRLRSGTLLAEFEGGQGRTLRIVAPGATIEIVGTLFAVDARASTTCVSVAHGTVRLISATRELAITGGQRACSDVLELHAIDPATSDALAHHAATFTANAQTTSPVIATIPTPPSPPVITAIATPPVVAAAPPPPSPHVVAVPHDAPARIAVPHDAPARIAVPHDAPARIVAAPHDAPARIVAATEPTPAPPPAPEPPPTTTTPAVTTPPPAPTPAPVVVVPPPADDAALYQHAEAALAKRDPAAADRALARLVAEFPHSDLLDEALYERARIAFDRRAWGDAQRHLDQLAARAQSPLAEPGAYLACRIAIEARDGAAEQCLVDYRAKYPRSPHDLHALGDLVELAFHAGGCARAKSALDELSRSYPRTPLAQSWHTRCP
jgi:TolA-binding protein